MHLQKPIIKGLEREQPVRAVRSIRRMDAAQGCERGHERAYRMCASEWQALAGEHKAKSLESKGLAFFLF